MHSSKCYCSCHHSQYSSKRIRYQWKWPWSIGCKNYYQKFAKKSLTKLHIANANISDEAADDIAAVVSCNIHLQEFDISGNNLRALGAVKTVKSLQKISTLTKLYISNNKITYKAAYDIAAAISCNNKLQDIDISEMILKQQVQYRS